MQRESMYPPELFKPEELQEYREDEVSGVRERPGIHEKGDRHEDSKRRLAESIRRDEVRARQLARMIEQIDEAGPTLDEEASPSVGELPEAKPGALSRFGAVLKRNRLIRAALVAIGLHLPLTPAGQRVLKDAVEYVHQARTDWEKPGMVLSPQSQAERDVVVARIYENGARSDAKARERAKDEFGRKLDQGRDVPLDEMYFELAKTSGEDPERIKEAKRRKDELVERLAARMGGDMPDSFIRSVVDEMYGPDSNYDWGQGSATEYFLTGKRNCVAIARAEQMVFEELLAKLQPEVRQKYQLGLAMEKQHQIATLTVMNPDGSVNRTIYLQPPIRTIQGAKEQAGSPTVDMATVKRAMASRTPVVVKAPTKPGEVVKDSPNIDALTNEPVALNLKVDGKLRGSEYVERIAEDRGIKPEKARPEHLVDVQELTIDTGEQSQKVKTANEQVKNVLAKLEAGGSNPDSPMYLTVKTVNSAEQLKILNSWKGRRIDEISIDDWNNKADKEFIAEFRKIPAEMVWVQAPYYEGSDLKPMLDALSKLTPAEQRSAPIIGIRTNIHAFLESPDKELEAVAIEMTLGGDHPNLTDVNEDPEAARTKAFKQELKNNDLEAIAQFRAKEVYLKGDILTGLETNDLDILLVGNGNRTYHLDAKPYLKFLSQHPEAASRTQFKPWINEFIGDAELNELMAAAKGHPAVEKIIKDVASAVKKKYRNSWISI